MVILDSLIFKEDPKSGLNYPTSDPNGVLGNLVSELPPNQFIRVLLITYNKSYFSLLLYFKKLCVMGPKSYGFDIVTESAPFENPVQTVIKLKGKFLRMNY